MNTTKKCFIVVLETYISRNVITLENIHLKSYSILSDSNKLKRTNKKLRRVPRNRGSCSFSTVKAAESENINIFSKVGFDTNN